MCCEMISWGIDCSTNLSTAVLPEGERQMIYREVPVKGRKVVCGRDKEGDGGCGEIWFTYEIPEIVLRDAFSGTNSNPEKKRNERKSRKRK
jgi:hypothetical protein